MDSDNMNQKPMAFVFVVWLITLITIILAAVAWGENLSWHFSGITIYKIFPIFGLIAFSLLWSQYIARALRQFFKIRPKALKTYLSVSGYFVLLAILLHPGLFIYKLWSDGFGFPTGSYTYYVAPTLKWVVLLGSFNLLILLIFELNRIFAKHAWWHYYTYIVDLIMFSILYHALELGTQLRVEHWYQAVFYVYGITYLIALAYIYYHRFAVKNPQAVLDKT
jgi:hypothetical protein